MVVYILVCLVVCLFFLNRYKDQRQLYQLYMAIWSVSTILIYAIKNEILFKIFVVLESLLLIGFIVLYVYSNKYRKEQNKKLYKMNEYLNNAGVKLYKHDIED